MKTTFFVLVTLLSGVLYGADWRGFDHFKAPGIVGAYCAEWNPLGITDKGFDFCVILNLAGDDESSPEEFWISKKNRVLTEIDSIAAVNSVVADVFETPHATSHLEVSRAAIEGARRLLSTQVASDGRTGLALYFDSPQDLIRLVSRLKAAGLDKPTANLLLRLGDESAVTENVAIKEWSAVWYEIDRLGGIERVTLRGSLEPVKVVSVLHEAVFDAGKVNPALLRRSNFFDLSLVQ
jgi:hypothetical protein